MTRRQRLARERQMPKSIADRLWSKVQRNGPEECWPFTGNTNKGYGQLKCVIDGKHVQVHAARVAYELEVGPIPEGYEIDHLCVTANCCNPAHLEPVTHSENMRRVWDRGTHIGHLSGAAHGRARFTEEQVEQIKSSPLSARALARELGCDKSLICRIRNGKTYQENGKTVKTYTGRSRAALG